MNINLPLLITGYITVCKSYVVKIVISLISLKLLSSSQIEITDLKRSSAAKNGVLSMGKQWSSIAKFLLGINMNYQIYEM